MRLLMTLVIVLAATSAAKAQLHAKPQDLNPRPLIREAFMPKNEVFLSYPMELRSAGKLIWVWKYHRRKLTNLVVTTAEGDKLTEKEIRKALKKPTVVLISADGKPVHKYYLTVMKPKTLVIIDKTPSR